MYINNNAGHMTKMATMHIYGKTLQNSAPELVDRFQRNWRLKYYNVYMYINHGPVMTLTYFTARST